MTAPRELYAWVAADLDGVEGLVMVPTDAVGVIPLVAVRRATVERLEPLATFAAAARGHVARLVAFREVEVLREVGEERP